MRTSNARAGLRVGAACHRRWDAYGKVQNALPSHTRGGSRMRESRTHGSVRGALSNERPYRVTGSLLHCISPKWHSASFGQRPILSAIRG